MEATVKRINDVTELKQAVITALSECKDSYAQTYLKALPLSFDEHGDKGVGIQLLYCLNNMQTWRGESARETKKIFKKWAKLLQ